MEVSKIGKPMVNTDTNLRSSIPEAEDTFHGFMNLPIELRQIIWKFSLKPRMVCKFVTDPYNDHKGLFRMRDFPIPPILHVHAESRAYAQTFYQLHSWTYKPPGKYTTIKSRIWHFYFNPDIDILCSEALENHWPLKTAPKKPYEPELPRAKMMTAMSGTHVGDERYWTTFAEYPDTVLKIYPDLETLVIVIGSNDEHWRLWTETGCDGFAVVDERDVFRMGFEASGLDPDEWTLQYGLLMDGMKAALGVWPRKLEFMFVVALFDTPLPSHDPGSDA